MSRGLHPKDRVDDYLRRGWWSDETVDSLFREQVSVKPSELAIVDPANRESLLGTAPRRLTWGELSGEVDHLAARLHDVGLRRGDVLGVQLPNAIELAEVYLAAWTLGVVVSPLPMQYREREIVGMANQGRFRAFISCPGFGDRSPVAEIASVRGQIESLGVVISFAPAAEAVDLPSDVIALFPATGSDTDHAWLVAHRASDPNDANDALTLCWTSGTESEPKGVLRAHYEWLAICWATVEAPQVTESDVLLNPFPMVNMAGINGMFLPWLRMGCILVQHHPFDLPTFLGQIEQERVTYTVAPPALLWLLLNNTQLLASVDLSTLTRIGSGSAPLQPAMVRGWQERGIGVINFFGSNEGTSLLSAPIDMPDPDDRARYFPRYGAAGVTWSTRVAQSSLVRLTDPLGHEITEPGIPGELRLKGSTVFSGYVNGHQRPSPFDEDGYLRTGDIFEIAGDRDQFLRYLDRSKDLVIRGGMNIAPAELEGLIGDHPAVAEVAVIGDADEMLGERVAAVVTLRAGAELTLEELVDFLRAKKIASYKLPERLEIRDALPRNPVGKIVKRELRKVKIP